MRLKNEGLGADVLDTNPRRLLVLVRENEGYRLLVQTQTHFLPPQGAADAPCLADPLEDDALTIRQGRLWLDVDYWLSCGSWGTRRDTYQFRYQKGSMQLIGADSRFFSRNSHDESRTSVNLLSGKIKTTTGINESYRERHRPRERWTQLARLPETDLQRMQALPEPWNNEND